MRLVILQGSTLSVNESVHKQGLDNNAAVYRMKATTKVVKLRHKSSFGGPCELELTKTVFLALIVRTTLSVKSS